MRAMPKHVERDNYKSGSGAFRLGPFLQVRAGVRPRRDEIANISSGRRFPPARKALAQPPLTTVNEPAHL